MLACVYHLRPRSCVTISHHAELDIGLPERLTVKFTTSKRRISSQMAKPEDVRLAYGCCRLSLHALGIQNGMVTNRLSLLSGDDETLVVGPEQMGTHMYLRFEETAEIITAYFTESKILDELRIKEAGDELLDVCKRAAVAGKKLTVNFRDVQFMSSAMMGKLVILNKVATRESVDLRLANVYGRVLEAFKVSRLTKVFQFDDDEDERDIFKNPVRRPNIGGGGTNPPSPND